MVRMRGKGMAFDWEQKVADAVTSKSVSCDRKHVVRTEAGDAQISLSVFDKYYIRAKNRVSVTVELISRNGAVIANIAGAGGGSGALIDFSWGSEEDFESQVAAALAELGFENA